MLRSAVAIGTLVSLAAGAWALGISSEFASERVSEGRAPAPSHDDAAPSAAGSLDAAAIAEATTIESRFAPPAGFGRVGAQRGSFAAFLRALPLRPAGTPVRLHTGASKPTQDAHAAVVDLDLGPKDLQQCADSVIRLRAEYLFRAGRSDDIAFHFTSGFRCPFATWRTGSRVAVDGERVSWVAGGAADASHASLSRYLDVVFTYAGTKSLPRDLVRCEPGAPVEAGDVYLRSGSPGHAMLVVDVAARASRPTSGSTPRAMLLAQGYMPAQDVHVVRNPGSRDGGAWYEPGIGDELVTPTWRFAWTDRWRFPDPR